MAPYQAFPRQESLAPSSSTPTAAPTTHVSHAPKIGGSEAAFIVLVIALASIVVLASIAIYVLLRNSEPSAAERAARRKYSIRRRGVRAHPLPIGLPGSFSEKLGSVFKGRRAGAGWVPASADADDGLDEWDSADEPLRERERAHSHTHAQYATAATEDSPRVGPAPASRRATLTTASESAHIPRTASHVGGPSEDYGGSEPDAPPRVHVQAPSVPTPDAEWFAGGVPTRVGGGGGGRGDYFAPQPRRADSAHDVPLFAGGTLFREDL
ncbi:hypothetical protein BC834DRAFT_844362 [Gloeopeniophorella convolvens]|nr:hypothetical protein BC834DRAFT_844362 [Gloeopeniophorella convolvens]